MNARLTIALILLLLLVPAAVIAEGSAPWFQHLFQDEFDVVVTIAVHDPGDPGVGDTFSLERVGEQHSKWVFEATALTKNLAISSSSAECHWADDEVPHRYCKNHQEECVDCDNDDYNECYGWCAETYYYQFVDECVPPGITTYNLYGKDLTEPIIYDFLGVDDKGQECLEDTDDDDDDSAPEDDDDDDSVSEDDDDDETDDDSLNEEDSTSGDSSPGCG